MEKRFQLLKGDYKDIKHPGDRSRIVRVYRIIALHSFTVQDITVPEGTIGGYVQQESNLEHNDTSWVFNTAKVFDNARITGGSIVQDDAAVYGKAHVDAGSSVMNYAHVYDAAQLVRSHVGDKADVRGRAKLVDTVLCNSSLAFEGAEAFDCVLYGGSFIRGTAKIAKSELRDTAFVGGSADVFNCVFTGGASVTSGTHRNSSYHKEIDLRVESGE
jgi:NDP-sugar pyrophosphorylase family protein